MRPFGSSHWIIPNADGDAPQEYANRAIQAAMSCTDDLFNAGALLDTDGGRFDGFSGLPYPRRPSSGKSHPFRTEFAR